MDSDKHTRSTSGVPDLRQQLVRRCVWHWTVAGGRCRGYVGADRSPAKIRRPAMMVLNAPRRDQHDTSPPPSDIRVVLGW